MASRSTPESSTQPFVEALDQPHRYHVEPGVGVERFGAGEKLFPKQSRDELPPDEGRRVRVRGRQRRLDGHRLSVRDHRDTLPLDLVGERVVGQDQIDVDREAPRAAELQQGSQPLARIVGNLERVGIGARVSAGAGDLRISLGGGRRGDGRRSDAVPAHPHRRGGPQDQPQRAALGHVMSLSSRTAGDSAWAPRSFPPRTSGPPRPAWPYRSWRRICSLRCGNR